MTKTKLQEIEDKSNCCGSRISFGYGFRRAFGFYGLGMYEQCEKCGALINWEDDLSTNSKIEVSENINHFKNIKGKTYEQYLEWVND